MKIISETELRVTTLAGAAIVFQPGEAIEVSEEIGLLAIQLGAKEYNGKYVEEKEAVIAEFEEVVEVVEVVEDDQTVQVDTDVIEALQKMIEEADPHSFKTDGTPKAQALNKLLGRTVRTDEREMAWELALNA